MKNLYKSCNKTKQRLLILVVIVANLQCEASSSQLPRNHHRQTRQLPPDEKKYDQCSHPFHSFLCNPAPKPRTLIPEGSASFNVKQVIKTPPPVVAAPSFDVKTIASPPPIIKPDPASNFLKILTTPPSNKGTIEEPSTVNCQQHDTFVKAPSTPKPTTTTPKPVVIVGESSFSRESRLPPQPYLSPLDSPSPAPTFLDPQKVAPPPAPLPPKPQAPIFEGQAANVPQSVVQKNAELENCKHSFHSFLCSSPSKNKVTSNSPKLTPSSPLRGDSTFVDPQRVLGPKPFPSKQNSLTLTTKTPIPSTTTTIRIPTSTTRPSPPPRIFVEGAQTPVQVLIPQNQKQPGICNDPFHSFLCQPIDTTKRKQKFGEKSPIPSNPPSLSGGPLTGDSSFFQPSKVLPNFNDPYSTNKPRTQFNVITSTTTKPFFIERTVSTIQEPYYFCNTTTVQPLTTTSRTYTPYPFKTDPNVYRSTTSTPITTSPRKQFTVLPQTTTTRKPFTFIPFTTSPSPIKADSSFNDPVRFPFPSTTTQRSTVHPPDPPIRNVAAAQTQDVTIVRPEHDHSHEHNHGHSHGHDHHHHGIDICKDPFHSFLCIPVIPSKRRRPTGELPERFKNPVPPNLAGASSFNDPTRVLPEARNTLSTTTVRTTPSPSTFKPYLSSRQPDIQPQPAQIDLVRKSPPISKPKEITNIPCEHPSHSVFTSNNPIKNKYPQDPSIKGESTFESPSKILPFGFFPSQSSENRDSIRGYDYPKPTPNIPTTTPQPGYVYNKPVNQLQYPKSSLTGASTIDQPSRIVPPVNFAGEGTNNKAGYAYGKPSNPFEFSTTTRRPTDNLFEQGSDNKGNSQGYDYPKPPTNRQFSTPRPVSNFHSTNAPSEYNSNAVKTPFSSSVFGANTNIISKQIPLPGSAIGESTNNREISQGYSYPKPQISTELPDSNPFTTIKQDNFQGYNYRKSENEFISPSNDRIPTIVNQPRPFSKATGESPICEHSSRQVTRSAKSPPSPSEFVRGLTAAASVLAASNDLPNKCNHPFLGYVCKRSSDNQSHNVK